MNANPNATPVYATSAAILASLPGNFGVGTIMVSTDQPRAWIVRFDSVIAANYLESLLVADGLQYTGLSSLTLYVETTGNDLNDGLTPATALLTLDRALFVIGQYGPGKHCQIQMGLGTFDQPLCTTNAFGSVYLQFPKINGGIGRDVEPLIVQGAFVDQIGDRIQSANVAGAAPTFTTITDSVGVLTVSAHKGKWVRYTTGAAANKRFLIQDNGAAIITLVAFGATGAANTDHFVIEDTGTFIRWNTTAGVQQTIAWTGGPVFLDQLEFSFTGGQFCSLLMQGDGGSITCSRFRSAADGTTMNVTVQDGLWAFGIGGTSWPSETIIKPRLGNAGVGGVDFVSGSTNGAIVGVASNFKFNQVRIEGMNFFSNAPLGSLTAFYIHFGSIQASATGCQAGLAVSNGRVDLSPGLSAVFGGVTYRGAVTAFRRAEITLSAIDISNTTGATDEVVSALGSFVKITGNFTGGTNTQVPVHAGHMGQVQMDDPGGVQTCTGAAAGSDVTVGANVVTSYALIAAGAAANISDFAAVSPMYCVVRK